MELMNVENYLEEQRVGGHLGDVSVRCNAALCWAALLFLGQVRQSHSSDIHQISRFGNTPCCPVGAVRSAQGRTLFLVITWCAKTRGMHEWSLQ